MGDVTTRRAIEICLSRVKMSPQTARELICALSGEVEKPSAEPPGDVDSLRAHLKMLDELTQVYPEWSKKVFLVRLELIRERIQAALRDTI